MELEDYLKDNNLKKIRLQRNLRQWQVVLMSNITISRISQIEQGAPAREKEKALLARSLNVDVATLFPRDGNK